MRASSRKPQQQQFVVRYAPPSSTFLTGSSSSSGSNGQPDSTTEHTVLASSSADNSFASVSGYCEFVVSMPASLGPIAPMPVKSNLLRVKELIAVKKNERVKNLNALPYNSGVMLQQKPPSIIKISSCLSF